jgi:hypothetical protein
MTPTLEIQDYEHFRYDESPLTLDEAVKKAGELRKKDSENFYRIEPANQDGTTFTVKKVSAASLYAELVARMSKLTARRFSFRTKR